MNGIKLALNNGAYIDSPKYNQTPLGIAACNGHAQAVVILLKNGADPNALYQELGISHPLMNAATEGLDDIVKLLLDYGGDVNIMQGEGTSLMQASFRGHVSTVKLLLKHGADINIKNKQNETALWHAARNGYDEIVQVLLDYGAGIDVRSRDGDTPLMEASRYGRVLTVELLLQHGADANMRNNSGENAFHLAATGRHNYSMQNDLAGKLTKAILMLMIQQMLKDYMEN